MECLIIIAAAIIALIACAAVYRYIREIEGIAGNAPSIAEENQRLQIEIERLKFENYGQRIQIELDNVQIMRLEIEVESLKSMTFRNTEEL